MVNSTFVIFGASSEIAIEFAKICQNNNHNVLLLSKNKLNQFKNFNYIQVNDYLKDYESIKKQVSSLRNATVIFFNGALYENRPLQTPSFEEINLTSYINFEIPYSLCKKLHNELNNINKFVFLSSMAAVKLRYKNYIYGQKKRDLENEIQKLNLHSYLIIRFGKVHTKMSEGHKTPPFSLEPSKAAEIIYKKLNKNHLIYANFGLKIISILIKLTPVKLLNKFGF